MSIVIPVFTQVIDSPPNPQRPPFSFSQKYLLRFYKHAFLHLCLSCGFDPNLINLWFGSLCMLFSLLLLRPLRTSCSCSCTSTTRGARDKLRRLSENFNQVSSWRLKSRTRNKPLIPTHIINKHLNDLRCSPWTSQSTPCSRARVWSMTCPWKRWCCVYSAWR